MAKLLEELKTQKGTERGSLLKTKPGEISFGQEKVPTFGRTWKEIMDSVGHGTAKHVKDNDRAVWDYLKKYLPRSIN